MSMSRLFLIFFLSFLYVSLGIAQHVKLESQADVDGFDQNTTFLSSLTIGGATAPGDDPITDLSNLANLISIRGELSITHTTHLVEISGLNKLVFASSVTIENNDVLYEISGFNSLDSLYHSLTISDNKALKDVNGFNQLRSIRQKVKIRENEALKRLDGFNRLLFIHEELEVENNSSLREISGLRSLQYVVENVNFNHNDSLENIDGLSNLVFIGGDIRIFNNSALNAFKGLNSVSSIGGSLIISSNSSLASTSGMSELNLIGKDFQLIGNNSLKSLEGLNQLVSVENNLRISDNPLLEDINRLVNLKSVGSDLIVTNNESLPNLDGLRFLNIIGKDVLISNNSLMNDIMGLSAVESVGEDLIITSNSSLADCCGLKQILVNSERIGGEIFISANSFGCSNEAEVKNSICRSALIFNDNNHNCFLNSEPGLENRIFSIEPERVVFKTDIYGRTKQMQIPPGSYTITIDTSGPWTTDCPTSYDFEVTVADSLPDIPPFGLTSTNPCNEPNVTMHMPFIRRCFENQRIYVNACNGYYATGIIEDGYVDVELDPLLSFQNASLNYTLISDGVYRFELGDINPGQCVDFWIDAMVSCDAELGQTLCLEANLYPADFCALPLVLPNNSFCNEPYDGSELSIEGVCDTDSIRFTIENESAENMFCYSPVRLYKDGKLIAKDSVLLAGNESKVFSYEADGYTYRMEVDQHPDFPDLSRPNATVERCGDINNWKSGLVNTRYNDDANPVTDIFCGEVTGSYDPNDKMGFPRGVGEDYEILPNEPLEYRIRFQNTGTDTAFTVVIRDTLDTDLDIFSVRSGVSSHDYEFRLYGPRVLEWTFNNILLPDSTTNEPASNGFVVFQVNQNPDLANGTELTNSCGIYFDFNDPIITNTTLHTVDDGISDIISSTDDPYRTTSSFKLYPNPTTGEINIALDKVYKNTQLVFYNQLGQEIRSEQFSNADLISLNVEGSAGVYFIKVITDGGKNEVIKLVKEE